MQTYGEILRKRLRKEIRLEEMQKTAKRLIKKGVDIHFIKDVTHLPLEEIQKLMPRAQ